MKDIAEAMLDYIALRAAHANPLLILIQTKHRN